MKRLLPYAIIGGVLLICGIIVAQMVGAALYLRSPERVVRGAFQKVVEAKSFVLDLSVEEAAKNGTIVKTSGNLDKRTMTKPVSRLIFSFDVPNRGYSGNGETRSNEGNMFIRFDRVEGLSGVPPEALKTIWAEASVGSLIAVLKTKIFPDAAGTFTDDDLEAVSKLLSRHIPFRPAGPGAKDIVDGVATLHYPVVFDEREFAAFLRDAKEAVKGESITTEEENSIAILVDGLPTIDGEIWVAKNDGTLRTALLFVRSEPAPVHLSLILARYNEQVKFEPPTDPRSLFELLSMVFGRTLSGQSLKLPFDLPILAGSKSEAIKQAGGTIKTERDSDQDGLSDVSELFYGTNPFNSDTDGDGSNDGIEIKNGTNPRGLGGLYDFGIK